VWKCIGRRSTFDNTQRHDMRDVSAFHGIALYKSTFSYFGYASSSVLIAALHKMSAFTLTPKCGLFVFRAQVAINRTLWCVMAENAFRNIRSVTDMSTAPTWLTRATAATVRIRARRPCDLLTSEVVDSGRINYSRRSASYYHIISYQKVKFTVT